MKKKQKSSNRPAESAADCDVGNDMDSIILSHHQFFDRLIELIPARFYLPGDGAESKPWYQGLSKAAKASLKQQSKQNLKLARRNRFDPESDSSTLHRLQQQQSGNHDEESEPGVMPIDVEGDKEKMVTYEELREKLRRKIALLQGNRGEKKSDQTKLKDDQKKRKRGGDGEDEGGDAGEVRKEVCLDEDDEEEEIIEYGKVKLGDEDEAKQGKKKKKRKISKEKELERAKKTQEVKKGNPHVAGRESWKAAASRAMGEKVHDNPRLIRESIKKEKRKKVKNAEKWKERVATQEKMKEERQRKRKENIVGRINEKKMRKIAKREKKLMRPGFEGRKDGFITNE